jgi:subfamily B ATP-binding cassette protein MsbA
MRSAHGPRLHTLTKANQEATDSLAYVVEENVLAHRDIRLYSGPGFRRRQRFDKLGDSLRHLAMKSTVAGAAMTPMTQMLAAMALSAVIVRGAGTKRKLLTRRWAALWPLSPPC